MFNVCKLAEGVRFQYHYLSMTESPLRAHNGQLSVVITRHQHPPRGGSNNSTTCILNSRNKKIRKNVAKELDICHIVLLCIVAITV